MIEFEQISTVDKEILDLTSDFKKAAADIKGNTTLSAAEKTERLAQLTTDREKKRKILTRRRENALRSTRQFLEDAVFGVTMGQAPATDKAIDDFREAIGQEPTPEVAARLQHARGAVARMFAHELYRRGNIEAIRVNPWHLDIDALKALTAFDETYKTQMVNT